MERSTVGSSGTSSVLKDAGSARGSAGSGAASNPPTIRPPRKPQVNGRIDDAHDRVSWFDVD